MDAPLAIAFGIWLDENRQALQFAARPACRVLQFPDERSLGDILALEMGQEGLLDIAEHAAKPLDKDRHAVLDFRARQSFQAVGASDIGWVRLRSMSFAGNMRLELANGQPLANCRPLQRS